MGSAVVAGATGLGLTSAHADDDDDKPKDRPGIIPISIVLATLIPGEHPICTQIRLATKRIVNDTIRYSIRMVTNGRLGSGEVELGELRSGQVAFVLASTAALAKLVPEVAISSVGCAFGDAKAAYSAHDGELGTLIKAAVGKAGFHVFDKVWAYGHRQITSTNHPIATPDDLAHFKIAVTDTPMTAQLFNAFGADVLTVPQDRISSALRGGNADGRECELGDIGNAKLYEYQHYCSMTNHIWDGFWLLANTTAWKSFPPKVQEAMARNFNQSAIQYRDDLASQDAAAIDDLKAKGLEFSQPDLKSFRLALSKAGYYTKLKGQFDHKAWAALEKYSGKLA
jgi:TRAP-type C4-dicarboxylate transport system substrate-binding protein